MFASCAVSPLNMLRALLMFAEGEPSMARQVAAVVVAHLTAEYRLLRTDPVYKSEQRP